MRLWQRLALLFPLVGVGVASALDVNGALGGGYWRSDTWTPGGSDSLPAWDWLASGSIAGSPLRPDLLSLGASADYRSLRTLYAQGQSHNDNLLFRGQASALSSSVLPVNAMVQRANDDFTTDLASSRIGTATVTSAGADALLRTDVAPVLHGGWTHSDIVNRTFQLESRSSLTTYRAGASQGLSSFRYDLNYDTNLSTGSLAETNYRNHQVTAEAVASPSDSTELRVYDRYFLRSPTALSPFSPRLDDNTLVAGATWRGDGVRSGLTYSYTNDLATAPGSPDQELMAQGLASATEWLYSRELRLIGTVNLDTTRERLGGAQQRFYGETVGAGFQWTRASAPITPTAHASVQVGGLEPEGGAAQAAYGLTAGAGVTMPWRRFDLGATYGIGWGANLGARPGSSFSQTVSLSAQTVAGLTRLTLTAQGSSVRRHDDFLGDSMSRNFLARFDASWPRWNGQIVAGVTSGLDPTVSAGFSDGLFVPARFNSNDYFVGGQLGVRATRELSALATARWALLELAGAPSQDERSAAVQVAYSIGKFQLALEDRYTVTGMAGIDQSANLLMVRVIRQFGARL